MKTILPLDWMCPLNSRFMWIVFIAAASERGHKSPSTILLSHTTHLFPTPTVPIQMLLLPEYVQKIIYINPNIHCWQNNLQLETLFSMKWDIVFWEGT
jgi:hypothetical protein